MELDRYHGGIIKDLGDDNPVFIINNYPLQNHIFLHFSVKCIVSNCTYTTTSICGICYKHHPIQKVTDYPCWIKKSYRL